MSEASFIRSYENSISSTVCDQIIRRFEKDHRKEKGLNAGGIYDESKKISAELGITPLSNWKDIDELLYHIHHDTFQSYLQDLSIKLQDTYPIFDLDTMEDNGYTICKFPSDIGFQEWNNHLSTNYTPDSGVRTRIYGFIWFLTDMELYFSYNKERAVHYKKRTLLYYPVTWTFMYKIPNSIGEIDRYMIYGFVTTKVM